MDIVNADLDEIDLIIDYLEDSQNYEYDIDSIERDCFNPVRGHWTEETGEYSIDIEELKDSPILPKEFSFKLSEADEINIDVEILTFDQLSKELNQYLGSWFSMFPESIIIDEMEVDITLYHMCEISSYTSLKGVISN